MNTSTESCASSTFLGIWIDQQFGDSVGLCLGNSILRGCLVRSLGYCLLDVTSRPVALRRIPGRNICVCETLRKLRYRQNFFILVSLVRSTLAVQGTGQLRLAIANHIMMRLLGKGLLADLKALSPRGFISNSIWSSFACKGICTRACS